MAGRLNQNTAEGHVAAVRSLQRAGVNTDSNSLLALRIKHGDQVAVAHQRAQIEAFLDQVATSQGIPRDQLVGRSLNRSGTDLQQIQAGSGITKGTATAGTTAEQHIRGVPHASDPWISTSRTAEGVHFFGTERYTSPQVPVIAIDLRQVPSRMVDVSTPALAQTHLTTPQARNFAARYQEVLIHHQLPPQAIVGMLPF